MDPCVDSGLVTPSGLTSVPIGVETPDMIELRKKRIEDAMDQGGDTPALYTILPEKKTAVGAAMMGSAHVYDLSAVRLTAYLIASRIVNIIKSTQSTLFLGLSLKRVL